MKNLLTALLCLFVSVMTNAQDSTKTSKWKLSSVSAFTGKSLSKPYESKYYYSDLMEMEGAPEILSGDLFYGISGGRLSMNRSGRTSFFTFNSSDNVRVVPLNTDLLFEFKKQNKNKSKGVLEHVVRVGASYQKRNHGYISLYNRTRIGTRDTIINDGTTMIVKDSSQVEEYLVRFYGESISLNGSYLFRTNKSNQQISFFSGIGFTIGSTFNNVLDIEGSSYYSSDYTVSIDDNLGVIEGDRDYIYNTNSTSITSTVLGDFPKNHKVENVFMASVYVPIGLDVRWSNSNAFFSKIHAQFELRPYFEYLKSKSVTRIFQSNIGGNIGLRYDL